MGNAFDVTVNALREKGLNSDEILNELSKLFQSFESLQNFNKEAIDEKTNTEIKNLLKKLGMSSNLKGYEYWVIAIQIYKKRKGTVSIKNDIYPQIADICNTTPANAERTMRWAVEQVFKRCPDDIISSVFGNIVSAKKRKTTNYEFLATLAEQI